jgi:anhydro-N-acetylmuramic acid kinase
MSTDACLTIGLMSGTSMDGIDGVLAQFDARGQPKLIERAGLELPRDLRQTLLALNTPGDNELHRSATAACALSDLYAKVTHQLLQQAGISPGAVAAIGAHGQTVRHQPELGYTLQLLAPARLVELTGIAVVADFRNRDLAAGGQCAPLVPAFHRAMCAQASPCVVLNLGGIANVTLLPASGAVLGFDTGPANMLLDLWCQRHQGKPFDPHGQWAATGQVCNDLLQHLIDSEPWFAQPPPKSTGRDLFNEQWLLERLANAPNASRNEPADIQATLVALTSATVCQAITSTATGTPTEHWPIYVCGGGSQNATLMRALQQRWPAAVQTTDALGIATQDMEALAFAWLAWAHLNKNAGNLPEVTGASGSRVLGALWPV